MAKFTGKIKQHSRQTGKQKAVSDAKHNINVYVNNSQADIHFT